MSKFVQYASYYLDDRDLTDLCEAQNIAPRFLLKFARRRGLFLSDKSSKADLVRSLCAAPISWEDVQAIAESINSDDRAPRQMFTQLGGGFDLEKVPDAIERIRSTLESSGEIATVTKLAEGQYRFEVRFVEMQPQRARPLQRVERLVTIEIEKVDSRLDIRFSEHEHAKEIVRKLVELIPGKKGEEKSQRQVSLWGVRDSRIRIKFFIDLINGLDGVILSDVTDLHVDHRFPEADSDPEQEEGEKKEREQLVGRVKHAMLSGDGLLNCEIYQDLQDAGYYIGSIIWTVNETGADQRQVEFSAGFKDPILATDFVYDVRRVAKRDKDGLYGKPERIQPGDRPHLLKLLETAAYKAMDEATAATAASIK